MESDLYKFENNDFEFFSGNKESLTPLNEKKLSFLKDALIRFKKNKASVIAFIIIIFITLFALIMPFVIGKQKGTIMNSYYSKKPARIEFMNNAFGILGGYKKETKNERSLVFELSKGVGALSSDDNILPIKESFDYKYQPVKKYKLNGSNLYDTTYDSYLSVGFIYVSVEQETYHEIKKWEEEHNEKIIYPMINDNNYCFDINDANYWYKTVDKAYPVKTNSDGSYSMLDFNNTMILEENYMKDENNNLVYYLYDSGGSENNALYKIRVLYYNYYRFIYGKSPNYILGTDSQGYDFAYRLATGIRLSLILSFLVSLINLFIGTFVGAIAGFYGGKIDLIIERVKDILGNIPFIVVATLFMLHLKDKVNDFVSILFAFILTGWISISSRVRTQFYRYKKEEYVMASKTLGAKNSRLMWKHIFPNALGTIITSSVLIIPSVIFSESMLSFLGIINLGSSESTSLGSLLADAHGIWTIYPHLIILPSIFISLLMISFNLFGNGLRDAFNPALRGSE